MLIHWLFSHLTFFSIEGDFFKPIVISTKIFLFNLICHGVIYSSFKNIIMLLSGKHW